MIFVCHFQLPKGHSSAQASLIVNFKQIADLIVQFILQITFSINNLIRTAADTYQRRQPEPFSHRLKASMEWKPNPKSLNFCFKIKAFDLTAPCPGGNKTKLKKCEYENCLLASRGIIQQYRAECGYRKLLNSHGWNRSNCSRVLL